MDTSGSLKLQPPRKHYVLLVHGIRDFAGWQDRVKAQMERDGLTAVPVKFGYYDVLSFLAPWGQWQGPYDKLMNAWHTVPKDSEPPPLISVVSHSFGGWLITRFIKDNPACRLYRLVLCGAVARQEFKWEEYRDRIGVDTEGNRVDGEGAKSVLNQCGNRDRWPLLAEVANSRYGCSGWRGFDNQIDVENTYYTAGHNSFVSERKYSDEWKSFLNGKSRGQSQGSPPEPTVLERLIASVSLLEPFLRLIVGIVWLALWLWPVTLVLAGLLLWYLRHWLITSVAFLGILVGVWGKDACDREGVIQKHRVVLEEPAADGSPLLEAPLTADQREFTWKITNKSGRHIAVAVRDFGPRDVAPGRRLEAWVQYDLSPRGESKKLVLEDEFDSVKFPDDGGTTGRALIAVFDLTMCERVFGPEPRRLLPTVAELKEHRNQPTSAELSVVYEPATNSWRVECMPLW